jgi:hypothetical protein
LKTLTAAFVVFCASLSAQAAPNLTASGQDAVAHLGLQLNATESMDLALAENAAIRTLMMTSQYSDAPTRQLMYCGGLSGGTAISSLTIAYCRSGGKNYALKTLGWVGIGVATGPFVILANISERESLSGKYQGGELGGAFLYYGFKAKYYRQVGTTQTGFNGTRLYGIGYQAGLQAELSFNEMEIYEL